VPNPICGPRGALLTEVDAREWAGQTLFTLGLITVSAPTTWTTFDDMLALLNGRGVGQTSSGAGAFVADLAADAATVTGTAVSAAINVNDRMVLTFAGATAVTLSASADNAAWGFDPAGQVSVPVGGNQVLTAVTDWARGNIENAQLTLTRGASSGAAPTTAYRAQTPVTAVRQWGIGDADDNYPTSNLQYLDFGASWGIDADGHVWRARDSSIGAAPTWVSTTLRDALGFTGQESETSIGALRVLAATYPCRTVLTPSRPWQSTIRGRKWDGSSVRASNRGAYSVEWSQWDRFIVRGFIDGPADRIDRQAHWLQEVVPYFYPGARCNYYHDWGDGRRGRRLHTTGPQVSGGRVLPFSVLYTAQRDGEYGRWLCRRDVDDPQVADVEWPGLLQRRSEVTFTLNNYEGAQ